MFDLSHPETIKSIATRYGDTWAVKPGSLRVNKTVLRFAAADGADVQIHVAEVSAIVSA